MKKFVSVLLTLVMLLSLCACGNKADKVLDYIKKNGTIEDGEYVLACPEAAEVIKTTDYTIYYELGDKNTVNAEFNLLHTDDGVAVQLVDGSTLGSGLKMERIVEIQPDGTYWYKNSVSMGEQSLGVEIEGIIPMDSYTKDSEPQITDSKFSAGAKMNDTVKATLKEYIDLTLECYSVALSQPGLKLTLADMGYQAYTASK